VSWALVSAAGVGLFPQYGSEPLFGNKDVSLRLLGYTRNVQFQSKMTSLHYLAGVAAALGPRKVDITGVLSSMEDCWIKAKNMLHGTKMESAKPKDDAQAYTDAFGEIDQKELMEIYNKWNSGK